MIPRHARSRALAIALAFVPLALCANEPASPADLYRELFERVQLENLFADSKTFADAIAMDEPSEILREYRAAKPANRSALRKFVAAHFELPAPAPASPVPAANSMAEHIAALWPHLLRPPVTVRNRSSLLAFNEPYVVPGGRFRELYYWDSYFTMLGLVRDGYAAIARRMVAGFADLIARYGHVPNGTRSYYLSRSQPPFFYLMVGLVAPQDPDAGYAQYLTALRTEHAFWMAGEETLKPGEAAQHVVMLPDGALLNRYWDRRDTPRDEAYREDVAVARKSRRPPAEIYRELRSAAESGWDFSSRWFANGKTLATIETTAIVPVDLNSLLYGLERAIAGGCERRGDERCVREYADEAARRREAINKYLWNAKAGCYFDYQWRRAQPTRRLSAATLYPLFVHVASPGQAQAVAGTVRRRLLMQGGLATTTVATGQQWDRPNGWAPLQWIAVSGLAAYHEHALAQQIAQRWLETVERLYRAEGRLVEKYNVESGTRGGGGEYPLQDGFGWTNGVTRALLDLHVRGGLAVQKSEER